MGLDVASFKWYDCGFAVARRSSGGVRVVFENLEAEFHQREVWVKGVYEGLREHLLDSRGARKAVYLDLAFPARGLRSPVGAVFRREAEISLGAFGIVYSPLEPSSSYLSLYPPPGSLYDQAVVSPDAIALFTIGRRHLYLLEEEGYRKVIMV